VLVGRDREERLLDHLLDGARGGRSSVLALVGEVGMGKSVLLDRAAAAAAAAGMRVLRARGIQSEAQIPFAGLFELLRPALGHLDRIPPPQREALEGALALRTPRAGDRFAVGAATLSLLAAYSDEAPLLVLVDDAQWMDGSSAAALMFALRRLVADPVAVLLGVRAGDPSLIDDTDVPVHRLDGLDLAATAALVGQHVGAGSSVSDDLVGRLHRGTGGNPLALLELAEDNATISSTVPLDAPLPVGTSVARVYLERCTVLAEPERDVLLLAATSDTGDLATIAKAAVRAGLDVEDLAGAEAIGLVTVGADRVEFRHPLARSAVYAGGAPDRRRALHRALAEALPDAEADRRAWHLALASVGPDAAASSAIEQAARRAWARSAYDVASQAFERAGALAVEGGRRCSLRYEAADAAWLGGQAERAGGLLDSVRQASPTPDVAVRVEQLRGHIATRLGPVDEGRRILLDGAATAASVDPDRAVIMLAEAVNAAFYAGDAAAMQDAAGRIPALIGPDTSRRSAFFAAVAQGMALIFSGEGEGAGAALLREAVALVEGSEGLADDPRLLAWAAMGPLWLRESAVGRPLIAHALEVARQRSASGVLPFLLTHVAVDQAATDRWVEAEAGFHEAIDMARETGQQTDLAFGLARLAWLEARQGREQACRTHAGEARALARHVGLGLSEIWSLAALGDLDLGLGNLSDAVAHFEEEQAALVAHGVGDVDLSPEPELIELHLRLGRREVADDHLGAFEERARTKSQPWALARAARCRGLLAADDDVDACFTEALAWHDRTPDVFETARTRLAYGARLRRARQRVRAREQLRAAVAVFDELGAVPWAAMARTELAATGETARQRVASTRDQLTPQELQVALLLASGRTTREAAAALFLSPKTIEYHLRGIYRKLDVGSREELAATMAARNPII
jgi:DNA-binding CsgD family transcriptional regulator